MKKKMVMTLVLCCLARLPGRMPGQGDGEQPVLGQRKPRLKARAGGRRERRRESR